MITANSWRNDGYLDPGFLYQSSYAHYDSLTGYYDFLSRSYDPALGRFFAMDSAGQFSSPYVGMGNVPMLGVDEDGEFFLTAILGPVGAVIDAALWGAVIGGAGYTASVGFSDGGFSNWDSGQFWKSVGIGAASGVAAIGATAAVAGASFTAVASGTASVGFGATVAGGAAGGLVSGSGNAWLNKASFSEGLGAGLSGAVIGGATAGAKYGIGRGIAKARKNNFIKNHPVPETLTSKGGVDITNTVDLLPESIQLSPSIMQTIHLEEVVISASYFDVAQAFINVPYLWKGLTTSGIDCSGLVCRATGYGKKHKTRWATGSGDPPGDWENVTSQYSTTSPEAFIRDVTEHDLFVWKKSHTAFSKGGVKLFHAHGGKGVLTGTTSDLRWYLTKGPGYPTVYRQVFNRIRP